MDERILKRPVSDLALSGFRSDGHEFAADAVRAGAAALVVERPLGLGVPEIVVPSVRAAMAPIAAHFYGHPACELRVVAVTGTNVGPSITGIFHVLGRERTLTRLITFSGMPA